MTQNKYESENLATTADEIFTAKRLFEVLNSFKDSYFSELYTYDVLDFADEYDEITDKEESDDNINDYNKNEHSGVQNQFILVTNLSEKNN